MRLMLPALAFGIPCLWAAPPAMETFHLRVENEAGLDAVTARTLGALVRAELRKAGHGAEEGPAAPGHRQWVLRALGRLGEKLPLALEEVGPQGQVLRSVSMTAARLEEADLVLPRLVQALLKGVPVEATARYATVTEVEAREPLHRPGLGHFAMGMPVVLGGGGSPQGITLGYLYTAQHWMLGLEGFTATNDRSGVSSPLFLHAAWLPSDGPQSWYLGGGIGFLTVKEEGTTLDGGMGLRASVGVEFFRLRRMRLQAGLDVYLPLGSRTEEVREWKGWNVDPTVRTVRASSAYGVFQVKVAF